MATAFVTGASTGIGKAIALRLFGEGYDLVVHCNKNQNSAQTIANEIMSKGGKAQVFQRDFSVLEGLTEDLSRLFPNGSPEVLVNNAGITQDGPFVLVEETDYQTLMNINLQTPFFMSQWYVRNLSRKSVGCIINISSIAGQVGNVGQAVYSVSKAGLNGLTRSLSRELGRKNIRVNAIAAGIIDTELTESIPFLEGMRSQIPLGRFGRPEEVAGVVAFLCSEDASYVNGQIIGVNGGLFSA